VAQSTLSPAHYGYLATGVDGEETLRANREAFQDIQLRVRRLIDVRRIDTSVELFGERWASPILLAPVGSQRAFHEDGEIAVARAARRTDDLVVLSTVGSTSVEDVVEARERPVWFQLYPTDRWPVTRVLVERAHNAGCPVLVLTVDLQGGSNREAGIRAMRRDPAQCADCHEGGVFSSIQAYIGGKPLFRGLDLAEVRTHIPRDMTWEYVDRLRDLTSMKLVLKGIVTLEDAELAVEHGVDGVIVSNHGGRAEESGRATIESLPEVARGAAGRIPVLLDGGIRRGTDIFKALAMGANAVGIGRPYLWGLAAFGQEGVEAVLGILRRELEMVMRQTGTRSLDDIGPAHVVRRWGR
jgi:isopentenyl diphosphate isomerase/L-lactate dehydrogenase-like FMN-dependent dehydrogenase